MHTVDIFADIRQAEAVPDRRIIGAVDFQRTVGGELNRAVRAVDGIYVRDRVYRFERLQVKSLDLDVFAFVDIEIGVDPFVHVDDNGGVFPLNGQVFGILNIQRIFVFRTGGHQVGGVLLELQDLGAVIGNRLVERFLDRIVVVGHAVTHSAVILDIEHLGFRRGPAPVRNIRTGGRRLAFRSTASRKSAQQHYRSEQHT